MAIKAIRGTRDLLPPDTALWNFVEAAARDVFREYNLRRFAGVSDPAKRVSGSPQPKSRAKRGIAIA